MSHSAIISDPGRMKVLAFRRHSEKGVLLQAANNVIVLSDTELVRLAEFLATDAVPVMTATPAKARFAP